MQNTIDVVVAFYNEDLTWLMTPIHTGVLADYVVLYCKGPNDPPKYIADRCKRVVKLPNVGREGHTYLHHIINNWDSLADNTVFFQGKVDDHSTYMEPIEKYVKNQQMFFGRMFGTTDLHKPIQHFGIWLEKLQDGRLRKARDHASPQQWIEQVWKITIPTNTVCPVVWGANFAVHKSYIHRIKKECYEQAYQYLNDHVDPEEGHFQERTWAILFTH